jgi:septal ring-binding cell division protein DamX
MAKFGEAFDKRSARLADHSRKLIREDKYSEEEIARFDDSLGPLLDKDFYNFAKLSTSRRPNVQRFPGSTTPSQPPAQQAAPAATPAAPAAPTSPSNVRRLRWNPQTQQMEAR